MKWYGEVAYSSEVETEPGVIENELVVRPYMETFLKTIKWMIRLIESTITLILATR